MLIVLMNQNIVFASDFIINVRYENNPELHSTNSVLFNIEAIKPGDQYERDIIISNIGPKPVKIYLKEIIGSYDIQLLSVLKVHIKEDEKIVISKKLSEVNEELLVLIKANQTKRYKLIFEFDSKAGNQFQGVHINEELIFIAKDTEYKSSSEIIEEKLYEDNKIENKNTIIPNNHKKKEDTYEENKTDEKNIIYEEIVKGDVDENMREGICCLNGFFCICKCCCLWHWIIIVILLMIIAKLLWNKKDEKK